MPNTPHAAVEDWSVLHTVTERLNAAATMEATLQALMLPAPMPHAGEVCLWTLDYETDETPTWLTLAGVLPAADQPPRVPLGARFYLPKLPLTHLYMNTPGVPVLIASVADDPRVDDRARRGWAAHGIESVLLLALAMRGRIVGLLTIHWPVPVALGPRQQRLYHALSPHAALLLDNLVLSGRQRSLLAEAERERRLISTVLDHVPVGILCIEGPSRRPLLTNRMARMMLAGRPDAVSEPLPIAHMLYPGTDTVVAETDLAGVRAALTGETQTLDLDFLPHGGARQSVETIGVPVRDADGKLDCVVVVMTDITGRKQAAEERARLQEEVIQAQAIALEERSTPLIPITDEVLVMPLIGSIDRARGEGILEVALHGARERRARVAILDITGVPTIDTQAAEVLTRTAQALRLLGVECVLSGVRPLVAQALVGQGVPLTGIVTCGSLQAGIEYALRRLGKRF